MKAKQSGEAEWGRGVVQVVTMTEATPRLRARGFVPDGRLGSEHTNNPSDRSIRPALEMLSCPEAGPAGDAGQASEWPLRP